MATVSVRRRIANEKTSTVFLLNAASASSDASGDTATFSVRPIRPMAARTGSGAANPVGPWVVQCPNTGSHPRSIRFTMR